MNKVYCENCKYCKDESQINGIISSLDGYFRYDTIKFRGEDYRVSCLDRLCTYKMETKETVKNTPITIDKRTDVIVGNCYEINKNNDCSFYKKSWWRFWVK
jgi:hypothetical protein